MDAKAFAALRDAYISSMQLWLSGLGALLVLSVSGIFYEIKLIQHAAIELKAVVVIFLIVLSVAIGLLTVALATCVRMMMWCEQASFEETRDASASLVTTLKNVDECEDTLSTLLALSSISSVVALALLVTMVGLVVFQP